MKRKHEGGVKTQPPAKIPHIVFSFQKYGTVAEALEFLFSLFPVAVFKKPMRPIVIKSQLYSIMDNRTRIDEEVTARLKNGELVTLHITCDSEDDMGIMRTRDYLLALNENAQDETSILLLERFFSLLSSRQFPLAFSLQDLSSQFCDKEISSLVHNGVLTIRSADSWWVSCPLQGNFLKTYRAGRRSLLSMLRRSRFKEMMFTEISRRTLGKNAFLGPIYHTLAEVGNGTLQLVQTSSGPLVRLGCI